MIPQIRTIRTKKKGYWRSRVEIVDIIDLVTSILGKWTPNMEIQIQMFNETTNFTYCGRGI